MNTPHIFYALRRLLESDDEPGHQANGYAVAEHARQCGQGFRVAPARHNEAPTLRGERAAARASLQRDRDGAVGYHVPLELWNFVLHGELQLDQRLLDNVVRLRHVRWDG